MEVRSLTRDLELLKIAKLSKKSNCVVEDGRDNVLDLKNQNDDLNSGSEKQRMIIKSLLGNLILYVLLKKRGAIACIYYTCPPPIL